MIRTWIRYSSTIPKVGPQLQSRSDIIDLLLKPTWSMAKATHLKVDSDIDSAVLYKVLALSGLSSEISEEQEKRMLNALRVQMSFILALYKNEDDPSTPGLHPSNPHFRLLACDHIPDKPHTLESLLEGIHELPQQRDVEKGEMGFDILSLTGKSPYFEIKGLIKR